MAFLIQQHCTQLVQQREQLISQLELKYNCYIHALLQQKSLIIAQITQQYDQLIDNLNDCVYHQVESTDYQTININQNPSSNIKVKHPQLNDVFYQCSNSNLLRVHRNKRNNKQTYQHICHKNKKKKRFTFDESKKLLFEYCDINEKCPKQTSKPYKNCNIAQWLHNQKRKIKSKNDNLYVKLAENKCVEMELDKFLSNKYTKKFTFDETKQLLFEYCNLNENCPRQRAKPYKNCNIGQWLNDQKKKIKSKDDNIYIQLAQNKYVKQSLDRLLFNRNKNKSKKRFTFYEKKKLLFEYCDMNERCPSQNAKPYKNCRIGQWLRDQKQKIKKKKDNVYIQLAKNKYVKMELDNFLSHKNKKKKGAKRKEYNEYKQDAFEEQLIRKKRKNSLWALIPYTHLQ